LKTQAGLPRFALPWFEQQELKPTENDRSARNPDNMNTPRETEQLMHRMKNENSDLASHKRKRAEKILRRKNGTGADRRNEANNEGHLGHLPRAPSLWALA
jgi:hypothetical protein